MSSYSNVDGTLNNRYILHSFQYTPSSYQNICNQKYVPGILHCIHYSTRHFARFFWVICNYIFAILDSFTKCCNSFKIYIHVSTIRTFLYDSHIFVILLIWLFCFVHNWRSYQIVSWLIHKHNKYSVTAILRVTQKRLFKTAFCFFGYSIITYIQDFDRQFSTYSRALRVCGRNFGKLLPSSECLKSFQAMDKSIIVGHWSL